MKKWLTLICKAIVFLASTTGIVLSLSNIKTYIGGVRGLLYFTNQSNIWIGVTCLIGIVYIILEEKRKQELVKPWMYIIKLMFTVAITLTGCVYCFLLAPVMEGNPWDITSVLTHLIVPVFSIVDFFIYDVHFPYKYKHSFLVLIPPFYYLIFASIGFVLNWDFGLGVNYPYFFLDWGAPVGVFGISKDLPHYIGTFYWLIIILFIVLGVGILYVFVSKKSIKNRK